MALRRDARRLAEQGRFEEALPFAATAVSIYRRLARVDPATYLPDLTRALTALGIVWSFVDWEGAVPPTQEATRLYRHLYRAHPGVMPDTARSLSVLLTYLWEMARQTPQPRQGDA